MFSPVGFLFGAFGIDVTLRSPSQFLLQLLLVRPQEASSCLSGILDPSFLGTPCLCSGGRPLTHPPCHRATWCPLAAPGRRPPLLPGRVGGGGPGAWGRGLASDGPHLAAACWAGCEAQGVRSRQGASRDAFPASPVPPFAETCPSCPSQLPADSQCGAAGGVGGRAPLGAEERGGTGSDVTQTQALNSPYEPCGRGHLNFSAS